VIQGEAPKGYMMWSCHTTGFEKDGRTLDPLPCSCNDYRICGTVCRSCICITFAKQSICVWAFSEADLPCYFGSFSALTGLFLWASLQYGLI